MNLLLAVLCFGGSVSWGWGGLKPCEAVAEKLGMAVEIRAQPGLKAHQVMPSDQELQQAALVFSPDAFYWYTKHKEDCDKSVEVANHLFDVRGQRPMILMTVPWKNGQCVNPVLKARCTGACILVELKGDMTPPGLHPGPEHKKKLLNNIWGKSGD